jgi:hypothetical protein
MALMNVERVGVVVAGRIAQLGAEPDDGWNSTPTCCADAGNCRRQEIGGGYTSPNNEKQIKIQP